MKPVAACLLMTIASAATPAMAQAAGDPIDKAQTTRSGPEDVTTSDVWLFSETMSPVDYSPVVIASATAGDAADGSGMKLSIACRGGNTSLMLSTPGISPASAGYPVSYAVDGGAPMVLAAAAAPSETSIGLRADVVRLLLSLPAQGEIVFRAIGRQGGTLEGRYSLAGLKAARERLAVPCKWPANPDAARR